MKNFELKKHDKYDFFSVDPIPSKEELSAFYKNEYYQNDNGSYEKHYTDIELEYMVSDCRVVQQLFSRTFPKSKRKSLLDVGCGEGYQSNFFLKNNWNVSCFDYSEFGIINHNPNLKNHFIKGELETFLKEVKQKEQRYSIIFLKNVLEHVISPTLTLKLIKDIMDDETLLHIDVPNDYSSFQDLLIKNNHTSNTWFCPPQHLHYFQFDSIQKLLVGEGFEIVSLQAGFPIEQFLVNEFSNYTKNKHTGKAAHLSRCEISNFLLNQGIDKYIRLKEAFGELSFGRDIHVTVKLNNKS